MSKYTTKVTRTKNGYFCRILFDEKPIIQTQVKSRLFIGPAFRDLFRTLDKSGGDKFTNASRHRKYKKGNIAVDVKHEWL